MKHYYFTNDCTNALEYTCKAASKPRAWEQLRNIIEASANQGLMLPHGRWQIREMKESTNG